MEESIFQRLTSKSSGSRILHGLVFSATLGLAAGCAMQMAEGPERAETVFAVTGSNQLVSFNAGRPSSVVKKIPIANLRSGESIMGIDFRPADGRLYALASSGRVLVIDRATGAATQMGSGAVAMNGKAIGFDFNPVVDRIRLVNDSGQNMRLHPETGAVVDADPKMDGVQIDGALAYAATDRNAGQKPNITAAAYTNNMAGAKATTNYAIDTKLGVLVTQGSREGANPAVSPNSGQLFTVGALGVSTEGWVGFDIASNGGNAFAAITPAGSSSARFYWIDLNGGAAKMLGTIGGGEAISAIAVAP